MAPLDFADTLRTHGMRATEGRISLLKTLARQKKPISIEDLQHKLSERLDTATLYRALEALADARLVERVDLQHGHAHYELIPGRPHHHHAVCRSCGTIEDIELSHAPEQEAARRTKQFSIIDTHRLEFFGLCSNCT